jgi:putative nucleotidyltransferase with HDIG domain
VPKGPHLSRPGRAFVSLVITLGLLVIAESLLRLYRAPIGTQWLLLALLTLISGSACVELPHSNVTISISEAFVFAAVLLYGPAAGTLTVALDGLVISFWIAKRRPELHRALFNVAAPALSAWCSAQLFFVVSGIAPLSESPASLNQILPALVLFALVYFLLNSSLIAFRIALDRGANPFAVWRSSFMWLSLNYFCGASVAILLVGNNRTIDLRFVGVVVPLLLVLYFTFKTSMERVEDAYKHVAQINTLYLSTIETLAMAIDAKDQITHGHIRRVQSYAVGLAKRIGVGDEQLLKAIEAAALLHDTGKLAIPEYILNKPGKLSPVEFEKMKQHASVGADILSAINFPYPVVPIVRHHHENWDGTGYPQGLKGTDIPIGARILSVVDCFDALTSDRPYRPRLSDDAALHILRERRGSMYDPLIVDMFAKVYEEIAPTALTDGPSRNALNEITTGTQIAVKQRGSTAMDGMSTSPNDWGRSRLRSDAFEQRTGMDERDIAAGMREIARFSLGVLFLNDVATNELEAVYVFGDSSEFVRGLRIPLGQRLSGWVAVNRQTIMNSDAVLDLGDVARAAGLRVCLSTPLISKDQILGVLTLYSAAIDGFTEADRSSIEAFVKRTIASKQKHERLPPEMDLRILL